MTYYYYGKDLYRPTTELYHHGIAGQKWGVRNGPPYPLNSSAHSSAEKAKTSGSNKKGDLGNNPVATAAASVVASASAITAAALINKAVAKKDKEKAAKKEQEADIAVSGIKKLDKPESLSKTLKLTNPSQGTYAGANNCIFCSIASTLRQQGYDVVAKGSYDVNDFTECIENSFKNVTANTIKGGGKYWTSEESLANYFKDKYGDNASGVTGFHWTGMSAGHCISWQIEDGNFSLFDSQTGKTDKAVQKYFKDIDTSADMYEACFTNSTINKKGLSKYVKNRV